MVPPDLIAYIRKQSADGVSAENLREALMEAGWSEFDVENALHDVAAGMEPLTAGASLHEDVAQVRGLVAHLASRVQRLEVRLTGTDTMTMPPGPGPSGVALREESVGEAEELQIETVGPERELPVGHRASVASRVLSALGALLVLAIFGYYFQKLVGASQQAPMAFLQFSALIGFLHLLLAWFLMRRRRAFGANLALATAVAFWSVAVWHGARTYHYMDSSTAVALGALMLVILLVMGRWIDRYSEGK